eukprot:PLAT7597.2.p3 GENE.PLAT7597.2~~PLAT7597.2.p3  ORF type:complete len:177 (-),score=29.34 PLAT7597.2:21-551(-)
MACKQGHVAVAQALLASAVDISLADRHGRHALFVAAEEGHVAVVEALLAAGADANQYNRGRTSVLYIAAWRGRAAVVEALLAAGADSNVCDLYGCTPLFATATAAWHYDSMAPIVRLLVDAGAVVDLPSNQGESALRIAAGSRWATLAAALAHCGAKVDSAWSSFAFSASAGVHFG